MKKAFCLSLLVASIIFLSFSLYPGEHELMKNNEIYITSESPYIIKFADFGGLIKLSIVGNKNVTIMLDGKTILPDKWFSTEYIGIHKLAIKSSQNVTSKITILTKGSSNQIRVLFGTFFMSCFICYYFYVRKSEQI